MEPDVKQRVTDFINALEIGLKKDEIILNVILIVLSRIDYEIYNQIEIKKEMSKNEMIDIVCAALNKSIDDFRQEKY